MVGTARTLDDDVKARAIERIKVILKGIGDAMGVECEFNYMDCCPALINDPGMISLIEKAGAAVVGSENVLRLNPTMGGEDFTYFARAVPGALFCLGVRDKERGITAPVHRPTFDISPEALPIGAAMLAQAAVMYLSE